MKRPLISASVVLWLLTAAPLAAQEENPAPSPASNDPASNDVAPADASDSKPAPDQAVSRDAARLVAELGADDYFTRQRAARRLAEMGGLALEAIETGAGNSDRDIRYACLRLLADIHASDLRRRLAAFAAGRDDEVGEPLPYWEEYKWLVGESPEARRLFVDMLTSEGELLTDSQRNPRRATELLSERIQSITLQMSERTSGNQEVPLSTVAALLLIAGDERLTLSERTSQEVYRYCYQRSLQLALDQGPFKPEARKLLGHWIARGEDWMAHNGLQLAVQHGLEEGLIPAQWIVENRRKNPYLLPDAMVAVARLGDESHIPLLEPLLADSTRISQRNIGLGNGPLEVQIRDVALAAVVHLSGQEFETYNLKYIQPNPLTVFTANSACFETNAERDKALEKWRQHQAEVSKPAPDDRPANE